MPSPEAVKQPHQYERRILVAVSGLSPAILTETIYGLAHQPNSRAFIPTEVHLITTSTGKEQASNRLLKGESPAFLQMVKDYPALAHINFSDQHIHTIAHTDGTTLVDLSDQKSNEAAADYICSKIFEFTRDKEASVHVSIAGGRKTMGFYVGYALSLFGRKQDRMSHVLVSNPYEVCKEFYYPTPSSKTGYYEQNGKHLSADFKEASVDLAEIPFVRMSNLIKQSQYNKLSLANGQISYSDTIKFAEASANPDLMISIEPTPGHWQITINEVTRDIDKEHKNCLVFLTVFLEVMKKYGQVNVIEKDDENEYWRDRYLALFDLFVDQFERDIREDRFKEKNQAVAQPLQLDKGMTATHFNDLLNKARNMVSENFGISFSQKILPRAKDGIYSYKSSKFEFELIGFPA